MYLSNLVSPRQMAVEEADSPESLFDAIFAIPGRFGYPSFVCYPSNKCSSLKKRRGTRVTATACKSSFLQLRTHRVLLRPAEIMMKMHCRGAKNPSKASGGTKLQVMYPSICCLSIVNRGVMQIGPLVACGWLDACLYLATSHVLNCTWLQIAPIATPSIGLNPRGG